MIDSRFNQGDFPNLLGGIPLKNFCGLGVGAIFNLTPRFIGLFPAIFLFGVLVASSAAKGVSEDDIDKGIDAYKTKNFIEALRVWVELASKGDPVAATYAGIMFNEGTSGKIENKLAREYLKIAADAGVTTGLVEYGVLLKNGEGGARETTEGELLISNAAKKVTEIMRSAQEGNPFDQITLSYLYGSTDYLGSRSAKLSRYWVDRAAKQKHPQGLFHQAKYKLLAENATSEQVESAIVLLELQADDGFVWAQNLLGLIYSSEALGPLDYIKARMWSLKAAENNQVSSMNLLGFLYANGHGVSKNIDESIFWYQKAISQNDGRAAWNLANIYIGELDYDLEDPKVMNMLFRSAERGYSSSIEALAKFADLGDERTASSEEAFFLLKKLAEENVGSSKFILSKLYLNSAHKSHVNKTAALELLEHNSFIGNDKAKELLAGIRWKQPSEDENVYSWVTWIFFAPGDGLVWLFSGFDSFDHRDYGGTFSLLLSMFLWFLVVMGIFND